MWNYSIKNLGKEFSLNAAKCFRALGFRYTPSKSNNFEEDKVIEKNSYLNFIVIDVKNKMWSQYSERMPDTLEISFSDFLNGRTVAKELLELNKGYIIRSKAGKGYAGSEFACYLVLPNEKVGMTILKSGAVCHCSIKRHELEMLLESSNFEIECLW